MTDAMRERPAPYIQNHVSWCWATAAKIVGFHFLMSTGKSIPIKPEQGIIVESMVGFRWDYVRKSCEHIVKAKLFCPEIAGLFCRIAGLFCHDSRANLSLKPVCFGIAIS